MGGRLEKTTLCLKKFVTFGDETIRKGRNVTNHCQGIELLKSNCIGTVVVTTVWPWWMKNAQAAAKFPNSMFPKVS